MSYVFNTMKTELKQPYKTFFGTLANQYRLTIIETLSKGAKNVTQICKETKLNQSTVSHNLQRLEHCGFVFMKPNGKERIYELNQETIKPLQSIMHKHMGNYCSKIYNKNGKI